MFWFHSIYEGFPNVVEISFNCLVISSNSFGGIGDLIKNENFGYVYNLYDSKQLSSKIKNNIIKKKNARKNLNSIYLKNNLLINFFQKL